MALLDKREPAVYVTVEDASYVAPTLETGRVGYVVIISDRGPHNRIVKVTSQEEFHKLFGKPNFRKCSQSFYVADKFLQYSQNLLVCRITPDPNNTVLYDGETSTEVYSYVANSAIAVNIPILATGQFKFINENGRAEIRCQNAEAYNAIGINMFIYSETDVNHQEYAKKVIAKYTVPGDSEPYRLLVGQSVYNAITKVYDLTYEEYPGTTSVTWENCYFSYNSVYISNLAAPVAATVGSTGNKYKFTNGLNYIIAESDAAANALVIGRWVYALADSTTASRRITSKVKQIDGANAGKTYVYLNSTYTGTSSVDFENIKQFAPTRFHWQQGTRYIYCGVDAYNTFGVGSWIYPSAQSNSVMRQIYSKEVITSTEVISGTNRVETVYRLVLDKNAEAVTVNDSQCVKISPFFEYSPYVTNPESTGISWEGASNIIFWFYANGAGSYYNNIKIIGSRNTELERMYVKADGTSKYKYIFMNIAVYQYINGSYTLLEGPWPVSLIPRAPEEGDIIRDYASGTVLFIEEVINQNSQFIKCVTGAGINQLITAPDAEDKRLECMLQLCYTIPTEDGTAALKTGATGIDNIGDNGVILRYGTDGIMFDPFTGYIRSSDRMNGMAKLAYQAYGFTSIDGSVEQMQEYAYPWYQPDYILAGGWSASVQDGARQLADLRNDCMVLGDTGYKYTSVAQDQSARLNNVPWNSWNSMLYVQYREIFDAYTGERFWVTPVYHAIERHLFCDGVYWISEPVAGIEKGAISEPIKLAYKANHTQRGDLLDQELNVTIYEPQGIYFLTQFTTWKRLSILKRAHAAKFICYLRKTIPTLLKDILQRKATAYWINQAKIRIDTFMSAFIENPSLERYSSVKSYSVKVEFDDLRSELNVYLTVMPIRAIERIHVFIQVV